jgi:hypothetical protein
MMGGFFFKKAIAVHYHSAFLVGHLIKRLHFPIAFCLLPFALCPFAHCPFTHCPFAHLPFCPFAHLLICSFAHCPFANCPFAYLPICLFAYLPIALLLPSLRPMLHIASPPIIFVANEGFL